MDVNEIANLATNLSQLQTNQDVGIAVLKKALDVERANAATLIDAIPATPSANLPPHLGQIVNTTA